MRKTLGFSLNTMIALLGACVADDGAVPIAVDRGAATLQPPETTVAEVGPEVFCLFHELAARLEERGVTPEEMQAAVNAGDAERVRELLGMTREEYAHANARVLAVATMAAGSLDAFDDSESGATPEGLRCDWEILECGSSFLFAAVAQPHWALGILAAGSVICAVSDCRWDDGSGPRTKQS
jgi:hypothetical protein